MSNLSSDPNRWGLRLIPPISHSPVGEAASFQVDVVAVHGLGGDLYNTWTYAKGDDRGSDVFWLSQLLPHDLPGARVYSFGYASGPAFSRSVASVRESARQLLHSLMALASEVKHSKASRCGRV